MAFSGGGKGLRSDINVTPLIDVVLVLLIVFMVLVPKLLMQTPLNVPPKDNSPSDAPPPTDQLVVTITEDDRIAINNESVTLEELPERVKKIIENRSKKLMFFNPDDTANYGTVTKVMDICRGSGVTTIAIMTK